MRRTYRKRYRRHQKTNRRIKRSNKSKKRSYRKGGLGSARQAFTRRFIQGATQTGKHLVSEVSKDIAGRLTKATLQDENEGTVPEKTNRIVKRAFNVPSPKLSTPKISTPKLSTPKLAAMKPQVLTPTGPTLKTLSRLKTMR